MMGICNFFQCLTGYPRRKNNFVPSKYIDWAFKENLCTCCASTKSYYTEKVLLWITTCLCCLDQSSIQELCSERSVHALNIISKAELFTNRNEENKQSGL